MNLLAVAVTMDVNWAGTVMFATRNAARLVLVTYALEVVAAMLYLGV